MSTEDQSPDIDKDSLIIKLKEEIEQLRSEISFYRDKLDEARILSIYDPLTGIYARHYLNRRLSEEISRFSRYKNPFSFIMLHMDRLKEYNDSHGFSARDNVIRSFAHLLKKTVRTSDVAARYDNEVFASILPQTAKKSAIQVTERLKDQLDDELTKLKVDFPFSISIALATYPDDASSLGELLEKTDHALYLAKSSGGNKVMYL